MRKDLEKLGGTIKETAMLPFQAVYSLMLVAGASKNLTKMANDRNSAVYGLRKSFHTLLTGK